MQSGLERLGIDELRTLQAAFDQAADHHSDSARVYDLTRLANTTAPAATSGFLEGLLSNPAVVALIQAAILAALAKLTAPKPPVVVAPPAPPTGGPQPEPGPIPPPGPPPLLVIDEIKLSLGGVFSPRRNGQQPIPYTVTADGKIVLADTSAMDDGSILALDAEVSVGGVGIRMEDHPELLGCVRFVAEDAETGETLGEIGGDYAPKFAEDGKRTTDYRVENGVGFSEDRYRNAQCMSVAANIKRKGGPVKLYAVALRVGGVVSAISKASFATPEVR